MKYIVGIFCMLLLSCSEDFIDLAPVSNANVKGFYKNAKDIENALTAAYASLNSDGQFRKAVWEFGDCRSDNTMNTIHGGNQPDVEIDLFNTTATNIIIGQAWQHGYAGILTCNVVVDRIGEVVMDETLKNRFVGEVKFLRALMYFNLVRIFGDVPLVIRETKSVEDGYAHGRVPVSQVYEQIIKDLVDAAQNLPAGYTGINVGRATSGAAKALLGKVYLTRKEYALAATTLKEVIGQGTYSLLPNYADLWKPANENHVESIFDVQFKKGGTGTGSSFYSQMAPYDSETIFTNGLGFPQARNIPTADMANAYEPGDLRKPISMGESYVKKNGVTIQANYVNKYRDTPFAADDADNNWPVLRYADVMLMYAEALNEMNQGPNQEAYQMVNDIRDRADLAPLPAGLNYTEFFFALEHERHVELAFEGHRWWDLVRTDRALAVMNAHFTSINIEPYQLVFPIPESQVNINPQGIKQNPGYIF